MINFNAVDFSERRSEEVMFFLTLCVCFNMLTIRYQELIHDFQMGGGGGGGRGAEGPTFEQVVVLVTL